MAPTGVDPSASSARFQSAVRDSRLQVDRGGRTDLGREVDIAELQARFGWAPDSWESKLLHAADGVGADRRPSSGNNGKISAAELDRYFDSPYDLKFLTSSSMGEMRGELAERLGAFGGRRSAVDGFEQPWQRELARRADTTGIGNSDGRLSAAELEVFLDVTKQNREGADLLWMPDQKATAFASRISDVTGEKDLLRGSDDLQGLEIIKNYHRATMDDQKGVPQVVSYLLSAADVRERPAELKRHGSFRGDPDAGPNRIIPRDYTNSGYDRGHMKPSNDSPNSEAMYESFYMTNAAPQTPQNNRQLWRTLEQAVNELVQATGGKATILTGSLYLDEAGKPLPPEQLKWIGKDGLERVAIPTHSFKSVLLQNANGHLSTFTYVVPNSFDVPTKRKDMNEFMEAQRVSIDELEGLLRADLYATLPDDLEAQLEADPAMKIAFDNASQYTAASLLWPQDSSGTRS